MEKTESGKKVKIFFIGSDMEVDRYIVNIQIMTIQLKIHSKKIEEPVTGKKYQHLMMFFDVIYPIGTIYENAHNPDNPARYMGFGMWKRYMEGRVLVSWSSDSSDSDFGLNNNQIFQNEPTILLVVLVAKGHLL